MKDAQRVIASSLVELILETGDGSRERPFLVTRVSDEYFVCSWLGLDFKMQYLIYDEDVNSGGTGLTNKKFDKIVATRRPTTTNGSGEAGESATTTTPTKEEQEEVTIWFDITDLMAAADRVRECERMEAEANQTQTSPSDGGTPSQ